MSTSGLTNDYNPPTLDGLTIIDANEIYIDGQLVDLTNLVPYTGADKPVDVGAQPIRTTYAPVATNDVVNLDTLTNAVAFVDNSVALTYLNKITSSSQTVAGPVTFTNGLQTSANKDVSLASTLIIDPNYQSATVSDGAVTAGSLFGTITNSGGVYQSTSSGDGGVLVLASGLSTGRVRLVINLLVNDSNPVAVSLAGSADGVNPYQSIASNTFPSGTTTFWTSDTTFSLSYPYIILTCNTVAPGVGATVQWYGLVLYQMGVALTNVTMPSQTADRVVVLDASKRLVASGINTTKLGYLDNVGSDLQTQLNAKASTTYVDSQDALKLNLSGSNANQNIVLGAYKVQSSATPSTGNDYINKTYGDATYATTGSLAGYLPLSGGTMAGNITMNGNGFIGPVNVSISGATAATTPFQTFATSANHYDGNPSTTYIMSGLSGYLTIADTTTRTDTDACMMLGTNSDLSEVTSVKTDGSGLMPLNFGGSSFLFTGGQVTVNNTTQLRNTFIRSGYILTCNNGSTADDEGANTQIAFAWNGSTNQYRHRITSEHDSGSGTTGNKNSLNFYLWSNSNGVDDLGTNHRMTIAGGGVGIATLSPEYMLDVNGTGRVRGSFYVGTEGNASSQIFMGGTSGDAEYNHSVIETRKYAETGEGSELLLFKANDPTTGGLLADRIRLRGAELCFDTYDYFTTDRTTENIRMTIVGDGRVGIGIRTPGSLLDIYSTGYSYNTSLRVRTNWAGIQLASNGSGGRTWNMFSTTSSAGINAGRLAVYDETAGRYCMWWKENGAVCINDSSSAMKDNNYMAAGSLSIGNTTQNYGGGSGWNSNTAGLLLECADNTEIAVHDAGTRLISLMYYQGQQNFVAIGRDMGAGWGSPAYVLVPTSFIANRISVVADDANGRLNIRNPNGNTTHFGYSDNRNYIRNNTIFDSGYVEIGASYVWRAPLDITTSNGTYMGCVRYFDINTNGVGYTCGWSGFSAMADTWGGARFMAYSDVRKKKDIQPVVNALETIDEIRIVSYNHIDIAQPHNYWGVIAQELEGKYPHLITQSKEFLPNIYQEATAHNCTSCGELVWLEMTTEQDTAHTGKPIRLFTYDEEGKQEYEETTDVVEVRGKRIKVKKWKKHDEERYVATERVFVYGTCEEDVRTVDKTQFGLLAVAGCQELKHETETQKGMIEALVTRVSVLEQRNAILEAAARQQEAKQKEQEERLRKAEERMEKMASLLSQLITSK